MLKRILPFLLVLLVTLAACTEARQDDTTETEAMLEQEIEMFRADMQAELETIDVELSDLEARTAEVGDETYMALEETLDALRTQRDKLNQDLQRLEETSEVAYEDQHAVLTERLRELQTDLETARLNVIEEREAFEQAVEARLDELDHALADLEHQAQVADAELDIAYDDTLAELYEQRGEVIRKAEQTQTASEEAFHEMKSDLAEAVAALGAEISETADRLERVLQTDETTAARMVR